MMTYGKEFSVELMMKELGELLSNLRAIAEKGRTESARRAKTKRMQIWRYEAGVTLPTRDKLRLLLNFYKAEKDAKEYAIFLFSQCARERLTIPKSRLSKGAMRSLGREVRALRRAGKLGQCDLARMVGVQQPAISKLENGVTMPAEKSMEKIIDVLADKETHKVSLWGAWEAVRLLYRREQPHHSQKFLT